MSEFLLIKKELEKAESIVILNHVNMDGDAVGSAFSLASVLSRAGKNVKVAIEDDPPEYLKGLCDDYIKESDEVFDLAVSVDCGDEMRLGKRRGIFDSAKRTVCIDHHVSNEGFADVNLIRAEASSTSEIVFGFIKYIGADITPREANQLFAGIITDTGGFKYSNTTPECFSISGELLKAGADINSVCIEIYESNSLSKLKLKSRCLDSIKLYAGGKISGSVITKRDFKKTGANESDCEGFSQIGRGIAGVEASYSITAYKNVKVSLRSKRYVDVAKIAASFGGGGHKRAAGFSLPEGTNIKKLEKKLIEMLTEEVEKENL